jgi:hypothetical protein
VFARNDILFSASKKWILIGEYQTVCMPILSN